MSKETLKILRIIIPGTILTIFLLTLFQKDLTLNSFSTSLNSIQGLLYLVIIFPLGGIYYIANLRKYFFQKPISQIQDNIKIKITKVCNDDPDVQRVKGVLIKDRTLMHIFYYFVDNDESLKEKAKSVRLNGLFLSSLADLAVISLVMIATYVVAFLIIRNTQYLLLTVFATIAFVLSKFWWLPKIAKRHISLSDEQLEFIQLNYNDKIRQKLIETAKDLTKNDK